MVETIYSTTSVEDKSLKIYIAVLRYMIQRRVVEDVILVKTAHQVANALTKKGACSSFNSIILFHIYNGIGF